MKQEPFSFNMHINQFKGGLKCFKVTKKALTKTVSTQRHRQGKGLSEKDSSSSGNNSKHWQTEI